MWLAACVGAPPLPPVDEGPRVHSIQIVSNGWHAAIVVDRDALAQSGELPEAADFPQARFLEFGWGDRVYYPAREKTLAMTLDAAFAGTPAVMHMAGLSDPPEQIYANVEVVSVALSDAGFHRLVDAIAGQFERAGSIRAAPVSRGLYADSYFYNATGTFHLFNTCNTWTARMLRSAGVPVSPSGVITAEDVMSRLRAAVLGKPL